MLKRRTCVLLLIFCLLAGCGETDAPSVPESSGSAPESVSQAEPEPDIPAVLPQEDPENPGNLAGAELYYTPGNRLTLYAMEPETGGLRVVRENDFWNGREVESVSPSGNRLLLSSWDGAPSRRVVALSLYDLDTGRLVNLSRGEVEPSLGWTADHWFPGTSYYRFTGEDTLYYPEICLCQYRSRPHLHRYRIGEDGQLAAEAVELECPSREWGWESRLNLLPDEGRAFCIFLMGEDDWEWFTWDMDSGKLLSRTPAENGWEGSDGQYLDGVFYYIDQEYENEIFRLMAYHMDTDTEEELASGPIPITPGMEDVEEPWYSRGAQERVWVDAVRDGKIVLRSRGEGCLQYRESLWEPGQGNAIDMGDPLDVPTFPVDTVRGYIPVYTSSPSPEEEGLYLPIPQKMSEYYKNNYGRPYPLAWLPGGELLFLAADKEKGGT